MVEIRRIDAGEWRELRDLRLRALLDAPDAFGSTFEHEARDPDETWIEWATAGAEGGSSFIAIALDEGRWVGLAFGAPHRDHPSEAGLFAMWVGPAARRSGVGQALVERILGWARSDAFPVIRLRVTLSNDAAVRLYARSGFVDTGERPPLRDGSDVVTMMMTVELQP